MSVFGWIDSTNAPNNAPTHNANIPATRLFFIHNTSIVGIGGIQVRKYPPGVVPIVIGHRVKTLRRLYHMSQTELGKGIVGQTMMSLIESGRQLPTCDTLGLLADRLSDNVLFQVAQHIQGAEYDSNEIISLLGVTEDELISIIKTTSDSDNQKSVCSELAETYFMNTDVKKLENLITELELDTFPATIKYNMLFYRGWVSVMLGRFDDARRDLESVEEYASLISDFLQGYCWYSLAYIQIQYEAYSQAMWYSERCTREFKESNNFLMYAKSLSLSATIHSRIGRISEAKQLYLLADNVLEKFNADESALLRTRLSLADVCETLGELGDAEKWTEKALFCSNSSHDYVALSALSRIRARLFYKRGDLLTARTEVNASIAFSEQCNDVWSLGWSYLLASGIFEEYDTKVTLATKAFQITEGSQYTLLGAMSAERLASLCEGTEKEGYLRKAMAAYRAYISKSTDVSNVEDIVFGVRGKSRQL